MVEQFRLDDAAHGLIHFQKGTMATEACAKGGHPPPAAGCRFSKRFLQYKEDKWTAEVAEVAQYTGAETQVGFAQAKLFLQRVKDVTAPGVQNPGGNISGSQPGDLQHITAEKLGAAGRERGHLATEDVAQHAFALFEAEQVAISGTVMACRCFPLHPARMSRGLGGKDSGACAVTEKACADQHAGIVIQK